MYDVKFLYTMGWGKLFHFFCDRVLALVGYIGGACIGRRDVGGKLLEGYYAMKDWILSTPDAPP